jgi:DNA-directed RNA polymerase subunit RPC12/RpoP
MTGACGTVSSSVTTAGCREKIFLDWISEARMTIRCPNCRSLLTHRSKTKGIRESVLFAIIFRRPFRCEECDSRFFRWSITEKPSPERRMITS